MCACCNHCSPSSPRPLRAAPPQVLGHSKTILVLLGGWAFLGDTITGKKFAGMALAVSGMIWCEGQGWGVGRGVWWPGAGKYPCMWGGHGNDGGHGTGAHRGLWKACG